MTIASINSNYSSYTPLVTRNSTDNNLNQENNNKGANMSQQQVINEEESVDTQKQRDISKEEAKMLLAQYQATQIMKNQMDTYFDVEEDEDDELNFSDIRDVNKMLNQAELLKYYDEERARIQLKDSQLELYA